MRFKAAGYLRHDLDIQTSTNAVDDLIRQQRLERFDAALEDLSPSLRAPLVLTALREMSQKDAALALGITVKGVETRVRRAKQNLRLALREPSEHERATGAANG